MTISQGRILDSLIKNANVPIIVNSSLAKILKGDGFLIYLPLIQRQGAWAPGGRDRSHRNTDAVTCVPMSGSVFSLASQDKESCPGRRWFVDLSYY